MKNINSPYSASFTAATMAFYETQAALPYLLEDDSAITIKRLREDAEILKIQSFKSRQKVVGEIVKRYHSVPKDFWMRFISLPENEQRIALFYVLLKTYRLVFDFQINVVLEKYQSANPILSKDELLMELSEISGRDEFVDSWSENTKEKLVTHFMTMLRQAGLLTERTNEIKRSELTKEAYVYYSQIGEIWFLQACLLPLYEIENIKKLA